MPSCNDAADSLGMVLKFLGADAYVVYDGPSALESLRIYRPAVVFLDIGMPGVWTAMKSPGACVRRQNTGR